MITSQLPPSLHACSIQHVPATMQGRSDSLASAAPPRLSSLNSPASNFGWLAAHPLRNNTPHPMMLQPCPDAPTSLNPRTPHTTPPFAHPMMPLALSSWIQLDQPTASALWRRRSAWSSFTAAIIPLPISSPALSQLRRCHWSVFHHPLWAISVPMNISGMPAAPTLALYHRRAEATARGSLRPPQNWSTA